MTEFLMSVVGGGIEATLASGHSAADIEDLPAYGVDEDAAEQGWVVVSTRHLVGSIPSSRIRVPYYQQTAYLAAASSATELAIAVDQTVLLLSSALEGNRLVALALPTPVVALVSHGDQLLVVHEVGVDQLTPRGLVPLINGPVATWRLEPTGVVIQE